MVRSVETFCHDSICVSRDSTGGYSGTVGTQTQWSQFAESERRVVLELLVHGPLSRTELAGRLDLSAPSLTRLTRPLIVSGLVTEADEVQPTGNGRPSQPLGIDPARGSFVGVKLTGTTAFAVLTDLGAEILRSREADLGDRSPQSVTAVLSDLVAGVCEGGTPDAVGIGIGGQVRDGGLIRRAPFLHWTDVDLGGPLMRRTGLPVVVSNDLDALMEAEHWFGDGRDVGSFAAITIGAGVGTGLIVNDRLVGGPDSGIGLTGHFPLDPFGPTCPDGHRGCAEALLVQESIRSQTAVLLGRHVTYDEVLDLAQDGDPTAVQVVARSSHALGVLVAAVANIAQPERIILTGEGVRLAHVGRSHLHRAIAQMRDPIASDLDVRVIDDDPALWARGAAAVAIQHTVTDRLPAM